MIDFSRHTRRSGQPDADAIQRANDPMRVASAARIARLAALPALVALAASLGACASSHTTSLINLPNGQTGFAVNCSGADADSSWAACYVQAGNACGATGYDIVSKDNDEGGPAGGSVSNVISANVKNRSMIVRCK